jgi:hypothetical protein
MNCKIYTLFYKPKPTMLVFYFGYILDDKNTLCNGNMMIGSYSESSYIWKVFISKHVTDYKFQEDVHEDSLQNPRQENRFLCNRSDEPLKAFGRPAVSSRLIWRHLDVRATRPDAVQHFRILQCSVQTRKGVLAKTVRTLSQAVWTYTCYGKICTILKGDHKRPFGWG